MNDGKRIDLADGIVDIAPGCFALKDRSLLSWEGQNYVPTNDGERVDLPGDIVSIAPGCYALRDRSVLSWQRQKYVPQKPTLRVRLHNWLVGQINARRRIDN